MGRLWLALAFIATLAGTVFADRAPCRCRADVTLPRPGATDVPTNARFWMIRADGQDATPDQPIQTYDLAPHTTYELQAQRLSFTTGAGRDETPPIPASIGNVLIWLASDAHEGLHAVELFAVQGVFDSDAAVVRITFDTSAAVYYTTPEQLSDCELSLELPLQPTTVTIVAIDLAGNESSPVTFTATPTVESPSPVCTPPRHHPTYGNDYINNLVLAPFVLAIAYLIGLAITANARAGARKTVEPTPLAITAAEALARGIRRRALTGMSLVAGGTALSFRSDSVAALMLFGSPVVLIGLIVEIVRWFAARHALRLASYEGATATVCRDEVRITVGGQHATLRAAPRRVEQAKAHGIPRATL